MKWNIGAWNKTSLRRLVQLSPCRAVIALVTGAASGIGKACVEQLVKQGAVVAALDISKGIIDCFPQKEVLALQCDVTKGKQLKRCIEEIIVHFGGIDMLITNAGIFPKSARIAEMPEATVGQKHGN